MKIKSDPYVLSLMHAALVVLALIALFKAAAIALSSGVSLSVERGDRSLNWLYTTYVASTVVFTLAVQVCDSLNGNKVVLIFFDYLTLTYLFFGSDWFANSIVYGLFQIVTRH